MFKKTIKKTLLFCGLFYFCQIAATQYQPWLGNTYEFEWRPTLIYQDYYQISSNHHLKKHKAHDFFWNHSVSTALTNCGVEIELMQAKTKRQKGSVDHFKLTGRYVWLDDIAGDFITLTTGFSFTKAFQYSLRDISSFHHGFNEGELFLSIGKEKPDGSLWDSRFWGMMAIGIAERGSPWLHTHFAYEKQWCERHEALLFLSTLWGLGHKNLYFHHFAGYGSIKHQSIDLGLRYTYLFNYLGQISLEYSYRVYTNNFPAFIQRPLAQVFYTCGF